MAIIKSAKKRIKSDARKRVFNLRRLRAMRDKIKSFRQSIASSDTKQAELQINNLYKSIDKAAKRGVIKKNNAARKKSRLMKVFRKSLKE